MFVTRRRLRGVPLVEVRVRLTEASYRDLQAMKGTLGNAEALELLIAEKKRRLGRRARKEQARPEATAA